jgi:membrane fusion protein, multidrug efflux system
MASKWTQRAAAAGILLGGIYAIVVFLDPARATVDASEREAVTASQADTPFELSPMEIVRIQPTTLVERLRVSGELRPINHATLRAKRGGRIIQISAREGQAVKAGDVLVHFETEDLQSVLKQREADRDAAEAERLLAVQSLDRIEQLTRKNIAPTEQLDKAQAEFAASTARLDSLSAQVEIARSALRDAEVRAPFDGVVARLAINEGSYMAADAELVSVVDTAVLEARMLVSTRDVSRVALDQPVALQVDGLEEQAVQGKIARIGPVADDGSRFVPVYVRLANGGERLKGGMFATGVIVMRPHEEIFVVPATALREDASGNYLLKLVDGLLVRQHVTVRPRWNGDDTVEVSEGLARGDTIVTAPLPELWPNMAVTISAAG